MTAAALLFADDPGQRRWRSPITPGDFNTDIAVSAYETDAIRSLGVDNLRRLRRHDPAAAGWQEIRRLLRPLDTLNAGLDSPPTPHRQRAMHDTVAVLLLQCAQTGRSYWGWTDEEWARLLGSSQRAFRASAPEWADDAVRPYLSAHAYLLGGFNEFHRLGGFSRLTLALRVFGRDRVDAEIGRVRAVLAEWGYQLGRADDKLLPMVACQLFLLNRSPHVDDLATDLFERIRCDRLLIGTRLNTLHAIQRAVAALGFCAPPGFEHRPPRDQGERRCRDLGDVGGTLARHLDSDTPRPRRHPV